MLNRDNPDDIRTLIDVVKRVKGLKGGAGILVANGPCGIVISLAPVREYRPETSAAGSAGLFPVFVKRNGGADGSSTAYATWAYDLYALFDTGYVTKFNLSGAIQPTRSAARIIVGTVTQALDGSVGMAYRTAAGVIQLWDCQELRPPKTCT